MDKDDEAGLSGAVRHTVNNLMMVVLSNLDLLARTVPEEGASSRQLSRAKLAAEKLQAVLMPFTRLVRDATLERLRPEALLRALIPLLEVAAGGGAPVTLVTDEVPALPLPRPALDLALLEWAQLAAAQSPRGTTLHITLEATPDGALIRLAPNPGGAARALAGVAALAGGIATLGLDSATLNLPFRTPAAG